MRTATSKRSSGGIRSSSKNSAARVSCCVASSHQHRCFQRTKGGRSFSMAIIYHSSGTLDRRSAVFDVHLVSAPSDELPRYFIAKAKQLGAQELQRRSSVYRTNRSLRDRLVNVALGDREPRTQSIHVEEQMYDGFFSDDDQQVVLAFHMRTGRIAPSYRNSLRTLDYKRSLSGCCLPRPQSAFRRKYGLRRRGSLLIA